jgi:hypothetical protein
MQNVQDAQVLSKYVVRLWNLLSIFRLRAV